MKPVVGLVRLVRFSAWSVTRCVLFAVIVFVAVPVPAGFAIGAFFDALAAGARSPWAALGVFVAVQLAELWIGPLLRNPWSVMQQRSQVLMMRNMFAGVLRGYGRHGLPGSVGESISLLRDDPVGVADGLDALCDLIGRSLFAVVAGVIMWRIDPAMTLAVIVPIVASSVLAEVLEERTMRYRAESREATGRLTGYLGDLVAGHLAVKVAGGTDAAIRRLDALSEQRRRMTVRDVAFGTMLDSLNTHIVHLATGVVLLLGARGIRDGSFTVGDFAMVVVFLDQLTYLPAEVGRLISDLKRMDVSLDRMARLVPGEPRSALVAAAPIHLRGPVPGAPPRPERDELRRLEVDGLTYDHHDGVPGITGVSFGLDRGSFTVVTGPIGSGKTTLLRALLGLVERDAGTITWNGEAVDDPAAFFVPPRSAYTPQVPRLFSRTLRENIVLGSQVSPTSLDAAVRAAVLEADVADLPDGLDTVIGPRGVKLSGGQVQRAAAARMFATGAELLVFDDLSSALDAETEAELWDRLFARRGEVTCLVVSHRPAALGRADRVLELDGGRLVGR